MLMNKQVFILWLQGWDNAPWLQKQVAESWEINNPGWNIIYIDFNNLKNYVSDIDYIYDETKDITPQAKSDIIRLSLLKNHGGVWADATMLCMQPLDHWVEEALSPTGFWMYHGNGGDMDDITGPASWFIISEKDNYLITKWKNSCDRYWNTHNSAHTYFWMDLLFKKCFEIDQNFRYIWVNTPYLSCSDDGQSHCLFYHKMEVNNPRIKNILTERPPYALKLWNRWNDLFPDRNTEECKNSNGYHAIQMSKRRYIYKHQLNL